MIPPELSLDAIARELRRANLAMMGQDPTVDEVQGVLLFRSSMLRLFEAFIKALGGEAPAIPTDGDGFVPEPIVVPYSGLWGFFPGDGFYEPFPAGETTFDLIQANVVAPDGQRDFDVAANVLQDARSLIVIVDSQASIELQPASGRIPVAGGVFIGNARAVERVAVTADRPYNLLIGFANTPVAPQFLSASRFQLRVADITLTKTNIAGVADALVDVPVVPKSGAKTLDQATWGDAIIPTLGWGKKTFRVDNTGANAAEVQVQGRIDPEGSFVGDLDVESAGGRTTIAAGDYATLETGLSWHEIRLQAAVAAAEAATDQTTLAVSYLGEQPQVR